MPTNTPKPPIPGRCTRCGVYGEHHSYMLREEWRGLCNDCAFKDHWRSVEELCDQITKEAQETVEETKCRSCGASFKQDPYCEEGVCLDCWLPY